MPKKPSRVEARDYLKMREERPGDYRREAECFRVLLREVGPVDFALETFGGAGPFRTVAEEEGVIGPGTVHESWDFSADCVAHLKERFPGSRVRHLDSFETPVPGGADIISADFNTWTFLKYSREKPYRKMTDRLFAAGPEWLQITDSAVNKLHLNFRSYARALLREGDAEELKNPADYIHALALYFFAAKGYGLRKAAYHHGAAYYLFRKNTQPDLTATIVRV